MTALERLTAQDLMGLFEPEDRGWPQDIGALAILEGAPLCDPDGRFRIEEIREHIKRRLHRAPRFRQRVHIPRFGLGRPLWVDADSVDLAHHVRVLPLGPPADEAQLLLASEDVRRRPLDRSRPLWEMWFLPGLPERRVGFFMKASHAIADGMAGIAALGAFVDSIADPAVVCPPEWVPAPPPSNRELFVDNARAQLRNLSRALERLAHPVKLARDVRRGWPAVHEAFLDERAPRTSLTRSPIGSHRRFAIIRGRLDVAKEISHIHDAKVNDFLMAVVTGGLRDLLIKRGESVEGRVLRAMVPVSLHREGRGQARGNQDGAMTVSLPVGEADAVRCLESIAAETTARKKKARPQASTLFRNRLIRGGFLRFIANQRFFNTYVTNVPGPSEALYFAGARINDLFPLVPLIGNMSIGVGALSYAEGFNITIVADRDLCADIEVMAQGLRSTFDSLADITAGRHAMAEVAGEAS